MEQPRQQRRRTRTRMGTMTSHTHPTAVEIQAREARGYTLRITPGDPRAAQQRRERGTFWKNTKTKGYADGTWEGGEQARSSTLQCKKCHLTIHRGYVKMAAGSKRKMEIREGQDREWQAMAPKEDFTFAGTEGCSCVAEAPRLAHVISVQRARIRELHEGKRIFVDWPTHLGDKIIWEYGTALNARAIEAAEKAIERIENHETIIPCTLVYSRITARERTIQHSERTFEWKDEDMCVGITCGGYPCTHRHIAAQVQRACRAYFEEQANTILAPMFSTTSWRGYGIYNQLRIDVSPARNPLIPTTITDDIPTETSHPLSTPFNGSPEARMSAFSQLPSIWRAYEESEDE